MRIGPGTTALLVLAGVGAGFTGSTAGLASSVSYPALLAIGLPPVTADVTNTVGLIGSSIGSVSGSRIEFRGQDRNIRRRLPLAVFGGACGAALLLTTPPGIFTRLVPLLVASASIRLGPAIVRRVPATLMRIVIAVAGFALAFKLALD